MTNNHPRRSPIDAALYRHIKHLTTPSVDEVAAIVDGRPLERPATSSVDIVFPGDDVAGLL